MTNVELLEKFRSAANEYNATPVKDRPVLSASEEALRVHFEEVFRRQADEHFALHPGPRAKVESQVAAVARVAALLARDDHQLSSRELEYIVGWRARKAAGATAEQINAWTSRLAAEFAAERAIEVDRRAALERGAELAKRQAEEGLLYPRMSAWWRKRVAPGQRVPLTQTEGQLASALRDSLKARSSMWIRDGGYAPPAEQALKQIDEMFEKVANFIASSRGTSDWKSFVDALGDKASQLYANGPVTRDLPTASAADSRFIDVWAPYVTAWVLGDAPNGLEAHNYRVAEVAS